MRPVTLFLSSIFKLFGVILIVIGKTTNFRAKKEKQNARPGKGKLKGNDEFVNSSVWGVHLAWLGVIRGLILLRLAWHSRDISNAIQNSHNRINHESDGSFWYFKLREMVSVGVY